MQSGLPVQITEQPIPLIKSWQKHIIIVPGPMFIRRLFVHYS